MRISAKIRNSEGNNQVTLQTNGNSQAIQIPPKTNGLGSSVNGGELLFLALATCYCNDIYREAAQRGIKVTQVEVRVEGDFGAVGEPAKNVTYQAKITGQGSQAELEKLALDTDQVAEIQNTVRVETPITLNKVEVIAN